jgi:hypothetical protein
MAMICMALIFMVLTVHDQDPLPARNIAADANRNMLTEV